MGFMTEQQIERLLRLETRMIPFQGSAGSSERAITYTLQVWRGFDYLIDREYFTIEHLVDLANVGGWTPKTASFEMRFSSVIAYWVRRCNAEYRDYTGYCRARA